MVGNVTKMSYREDASTFPQYGISSTIFHLSGKPLAGLMYKNK